MQPQQPNQPSLGGTPPDPQGAVSFQQPTVISPQTAVPPAPQPAVTPPTEAFGTLPGASTAQQQPTVQQPFSPQPPQPTPPSGYSPQPPIPPTPTAQPFMTSSVVSGNFDSASAAQGPSITPTPTKKSKKKWFLGSGVVATVLLLSTGFVFGYYIPNTPANVWKTGMDHTGQAVESLMTEATSSKNTEAFKQYQLTADFDYKSDSDQVVSGTVNAKTNGTDSDSNGSVSVKQLGSSPKTVLASVRTIKSNDSTLPDIFFKVSGLESFGFDAYVPNLASYENRWIEIDGSYLESLGGEAVDTTSKDQISSQDAHELAVAVSGVTREYLFGVDESKAVLENKSFVGKETIDGVKTYHYTVSVNKTNFQAYCAALGDKLATTSAYKKLVGSENTSEAKNSFVKSCKETDVSGTFDIWIDSGYKLVHKVRFTDENNKDSYVDFGQTYNGSDTLPFFIKAYDADSKSTLSVNLTYNTKTNQVDGKGSIKSTGSDGGSGTLKFQLKPSTTDINIERPTNTIKIDQLLSELGLQ